MYRKNGHLACKNRANGRGGLEGRKDTFPKITPKTPKNFIKCLIFNGLTLWSSLWSGFGVSLNSLIFNALQTLSKCLIFNGFAVVGQG